MTDRTNHCTGCKERQDHIEALTAENERLRGALGSIARNSCCKNCQEAALVARAALGDTQ